MSEQTYNILFLCTGNSARSIMAECLMNARGKGRFHTYSAGSQPTGTVNPFAIEMVRTLNISSADLRSKSWDEFAAPDAPQMDFIITVCDKAAGETCPIWPGHPASAHWGFEDPAAVEGSDDKKREAFHKVFHQINARISLFLALPMDRLDRMSLLNEMRVIGATQPEQA